jgi:hypothetical protein
MKLRQMREAIDAAADKVSDDVFALTFMTTEASEAHYSMNMTREVLVRLQIRIEEALRAHTPPTPHGLGDVEADRQKKS